MSTLSINNTMQSCTWNDIPEDIRVAIYARAFLYKLRDYFMPLRKLKNRVAHGCCAMQMKIDDCEIIRPLDVWWACERLRIAISCEKDKTIYQALHPNNHIMTINRAIINFLERIHYYSGPDSPYNGRVWTPQLQHVWYNDILPQISELFKMVSLA